MRVEKYPIRIIEGNSFTLSIELQQIAWGHGTGTTSEFVPLESDRIRVWLVSKAGERIEAFNAVVSANELLISFDEGICKGLYDIEIFVYRANGTRLHSRLEKRIHIVPTTDKMGIEADTIKLTGAVLLVIDGVSLQWDDTPTEGSGAVVTSDGIYHALQELREDFDNAKIEVDEELDGTSANPVQNKAITEAIEGIEDDLQTLQSNSVNVEVDAQSREFAITNANGVKIGTIKVGTGISGVATLAFKDKAGHEINVTLPNLAYNENTQYLEYIDAIGAHHNTIKLSNLQIKGVFSETPSMGDWALGDLILVGADSSYELNVFDGTNWQSLGSINDISLVADQISFISNSGLESTNVRDAIDEVNVIGNSDSDADLDIADENGKVALRLSGGDIKTKNFDSRNIKISVGDDDEADLDFADDNGHVALRVSGGHIKTKNFDSANVVGKVIKVLIYGNSWAGDAVSYAGPLLDEILNGDAKVHIGFCYQRSSSLQDHYNNADNNSSYEKFFYYNSDNGWVSESSVSFNDALHLENWDIVLLQQVSGSAAIVNSYQPYLSYLIDIISSRANKPVKFGWILARDKFNQSTHEQTPIWNNAKTIAQALLNSTLIDFVVPTGTATENARTTSLDELGIHLTNDGTHLQDGVPCLVEAYCFVLSILNVYGFGNKSINGSKFIPGATIQPNGSVIGVTSGNIVLAQKCAIFAFKNPFVITDIDNLDLETEYQHLKSLETTNTENTSSSES